MSKGRALQLFFVDGTPDGLVTAEVFNWTGHVLRGPRTRLRDIVNRPEAARTGIYLLLGETDDGPSVYVGEADHIGKRLVQHQQEKDWWDQVALVTAANDALHKAHAAYLERQVHLRASSAKRMSLQNGNTPGGATLGEADTATMEDFLATLSIVLPALGVSLLEPARTEDPEPDGPSTHSREQALFVYDLAKADVSASARVEEGDLIVERGSRCRDRWVGADHAYKDLRAELLARGVLIENDTGIKFAQDFRFSSPSAAGAVIAGRSSNGRVEWRHRDTGLSLKDWEARELEASI